MLVEKEPQRVRDDLDAVLARKPGIQA